MLLVPLAESSSPPPSSTTTPLPSAQPNLTSPLFPVNIEQDMFCDVNGGDEMKDIDEEDEEEEDFEEEEEEEEEEKEEGSDDSRGNVNEFPEDCD
jgi:hypothetical protein